MIGTCSCIESLTDKTLNEEESEWKQARAKQAKKRHSRRRDRRGCRSRRGG